MGRLTVRDEVSGASPETSALLRMAPEAERRLREAGSVLAESETVPPSIGDVLAELSDSLTAVPERDLDAVDPYLVLSIYRGIAEGLRALTDQNEGSRRALRVAIERIRQAFRDILEESPIAEGTSVNSVMRWLVDTLDVPQTDIADLVGTNPRTLQRWLAADRPSTPRPEEARRIRLIARAANHLRHALTGVGVVQWFHRPHPRLEGDPPLSLLDAPEAAPQLFRLASSARSGGAA